MIQRYRAAALSRVRGPALAFFALLGLWAFPACELAGGGERAAPECVSLSSERLQRLDDAMQEEVEAGRKAGIAVLVARRGEVVHERAFGYADLESRTPLRTDAFFRVYSMTKPVVSVALLMLYEEGCFQLTDPLHDYVPAFEDVRVYAGDAPDGGMVLEEPKRPITMHDVLRHTAGFGRYSLAPPTNSLEAAYAAAGIHPAELDSVRELCEEKLPQLPLLYHPGEQWVYSVAHDVQAYLVEYFSGLPIDQFVQERIFAPLDMNGSFYGDPTTRGPRRTTVHGPNEAGELVAIDEPLGFSHDRFRQHPFGGAGLTMTLGDYARFSLMLLGGGELDGVRLLGRKTVELLTSDHLSPGMSVPFFPGYGYGLGVGVCRSPVAAGNLGSAGQFGWGGAATTWVIIDPREELVAVLGAQHVPVDSELFRRFQTLVYQAIVE